MLKHYTATALTHTLIQEACQESRACWERPGLGTLVAQTLRWQHGRGWTYRKSKSHSQAQNLGGNEDPVTSLTLSPQSAPGPWTSISSFSLPLSYTYTGSYFSEASPPGSDPTSVILTESCKNLTKKELVNLFVPLCQMQENIPPKIVMNVKLVIMY